MGDATQHHDERGGGRGAGDPLSSVCEPRARWRARLSPRSSSRAWSSVAPRSSAEAATATVSRLDGRIYATSWPAGAINRWPQSESVVTDFNGPASGDYAGFHGLVSLRFSHPDESGPFVTQLLVERALATVERARLVEAVATRQASVDHLERALGLEPGDRCRRGDPDGEPQADRSAGLRPVEPSQPANQPQAPRDRARGGPGRGDRARRAESPFPSRASGPSSPDVGHPISPARG